MTASPPRRPSTAYRYLFVLGLGLLMGLVATVMAARVLQAGRDRFPHSLMQVMQHQADLLQQAHQQNRCLRSDTLPRWQTLRWLSDDLEAAFPHLKDDSRFQQHADRYRAGLRAALAEPASDCAALDRRVQMLQDDCRACHQDMR